MVLLHVIPLENQIRTVMSIWEINDSDLGQFIKQLIQEWPQNFYVTLLLCIIS